MPPSKRPASPKKVYRAALLRIRFADTILKAREKTLAQGDPEKLRRAREKLEKQQREEKARLQAEARAAQEAKRQAEAEFAVEAIRQRELEREAGRQASLKTENNTEINENRQIIEEMEMLTLTVVDNSVSSIYGMIPIDPEDDMGEFKLLESANSLEQIRLYMKRDDKEEDEEG